MATVAESCGARLDPPECDGEKLWLQDLEFQCCCNFGHEGVAAVAGLTQLTALDLSGCRIDCDRTVPDAPGGGPSEATRLFRAATIKLFCNLTGLRRLNLTNCGALTADWLHPYYTKLRNLTQLLLGDVTMPASNAGVRALAPLTGLQRLSLAGLGVLLPSATWQLTALQDLTSLDFSIQKLTDDHLTAITRLRNLRELTMLSSRRVSDDSFRVLCRRLTGLERLCTSKAEVSRYGLQLLPLHLHSRLRSLTLTDCAKVSDNMASVLSQLSALSRLDLSSNRFLGGQFTQHLTGLSSLAFLDISDCEFATDDNLAHVSGLTSLCHLNLLNNDVREKTAASLGNLRRLTYLGISNSGFTDAMMQPLSGLRDMRELELMATCITDQGLAHLEHMTALQALNIGFNDAITNEGVRRHLQPLASNHSLAEVGMWKMLGIDARVTEILPTCFIKGALVPKPSSCYGPSI